MADNDDPKMAGYRDLEHFRITDHDATSRRIRDMPYGRRREDAEVSPAELNFGTLELGETSVLQTVTVFNKGYDFLKIKSIKVVGDFIISHEIGGEIAPNSSATIDVSFQPRRGGAITGGLYIDTGDAAGSEFVKLRGAGEGDGELPEPEPSGTASLSANSLNFGNVPVGSQSSVRELVLTNTGEARLAISSIGISDGFTQTNNCGNGLDAGASCTISARMVPTSVGSKTGQVRVFHNGDGAQGASLVGTAIAVSTLPVLSISDATLDVRDEEVPVQPRFVLSTNSVLIPNTFEESIGEAAFEILGSEDGDISMSILPAAGNGFLFAYGPTETGPWFPATSYIIPQDGSFWCRVRYSGDIGTYSRTVTFGTTDQTATVSISITVIEKPEPPGINYRIRIAGNQFYRAVDPSEPWGTLPDEGGISLNSVNWFGAEGDNFTPHGTWSTGRRWTEILDEIHAAGFNCIRLPFSGQMVRSNPVVPSNAIDPEVNEDIAGLNALDVFDRIIDYCKEIGLYVVLDHHRRSSGNGADGAPTGTGYTKANWFDTWDILTARYKNKINVVGADLHNEPHDLTWTNWASLCEELGNRIHQTAPNWIIFVEGVGSEDSDHYWWGGHLKGVSTRPVSLNLPHRVAYSPHEYGQSVGSQAWLATDSTTVTNYPLNLPAIWDAYWGFIFYNNIAPVWIGEMGGHFGLDPETGALNKPHRVPETQWMTTLVRYMAFDKNADGTIGGSESAPANKTPMSFSWWSWNPNSGDTGGLVQGDWTTPQTAKLNLLQPLLDY